MLSLWTPKRDIWDCIEEEDYDDGDEIIMYNNDNNNTHLLGDPAGYELSDNQAHYAQKEKMISWGDQPKLSPVYNNYLLDSGASCHMTNDPDNLTNIDKVDKSIIVAQSSICKTNKRGDINLKVMGMPSDMPITFHKVYYV